MLLSNIICSKLQNKSLHENYCGNISTIISRNLIYTCSKNIFSNKYQCILEPIVNSIDAYNNLSNNNVGKFGLGFFSLFSLLLDNPKNIMCLESYHKSCSWKVIINKHINDFNINFSDIIKNNNYNGLYIRIQLYNEINVDKYLKEISKLKFISTCSIYVNNILINNFNSNNIIYVNITKHLIIIYDYATGISKDTLFNILLIPGISTKISTKNISKNIYDVSIGELTNIVNNNSESNFYILVGEIILYTDTIYHYEHNYDIILQLDKNTQIPSSRDDVDINNINTQRELFFNIRFLFSMCMNNDFKYLTLKKFIRRYVNKHPLLSQQIEIIISETLNIFLDNNYYLVPYQYLDLYKCITKNCIPDNGILNPLVENKLLSEYNFNKTLINNKNVFIFNENNLYNDLLSAEYGYSSSILFLYIDFTKNDNWFEKLLILFPQLRLNDDIIAPYYISKNLRHHFINNQRKLLGLETWYNINTLEKYYSISLEILFKNVKNDEFLINYLYMYDLIFDQLRPSFYTYAEGKQEIETNNDLYINKYYKSFNDIDNIIHNNLLNNSKILNIFLEILRDHFNFILKEDLNFIPCDILIQIYFTLSKSFYDYIENKYELVFYQ